LATPRFIVENPELEVYAVPRVAFLGQLDLSLRVF
jgi:hypothetical protein